MEARSVIKNPNWDTLSVGKEIVIDTDWIRQHMTIVNETASDVDTSGGVDLLRSSLGRGARQITETVSHVQQIIEAAALEGSKKGKLVLQSLVQGIRDICTMYRCLFPVLFQKELEVPQLGLLIANDLFYLGDEMMLLTVTVSNFKAMAPDVSFLKEARELHLTGQRIMDKQVKGGVVFVPERLTCFLGCFAEIGTGRCVESSRQLWISENRTAGNCIAQSRSAAAANVDTTGACHA